MGFCLNIIVSGGYGVIFFGSVLVGRGCILVFGLFPHNICMFALLEFYSLNAPSRALGTSDSVSSFEF
jgi:hypothetical protein